MRFALFSVLLFSVAITCQALTPTSFLSSADRDRLRGVFSAALAKDDLASLHYAILGYNLLGETAPKAQDLCKTLQLKMDAAAGGSALNSLYQAASAGQALKCSLKASADATKVLQTALSSTDVSPVDLFNAVLAQKGLGNKVDGGSVLKNLQVILKKDDSVTNLGYAFQIAANVDGGADVAKAFFDRVEDAVVQADEVDGKMLQFEGGLSVTDLVLTGAYQLSAKLQKAPAITKMQAAKFANYILSRKSVQAAKGGFHLLEALATLATNKYHIPVAVTLGEGSSVVSETSPKVQVRITDVLGTPLGKMEVTIESAMRQSDGAVVMSKSKMTAVGTDGSTYEADMMAAKPGRGFYELTLSAIPAKADERLVGNTGAVLLVKALGSVVVSESAIGVVDADQSTAPKLDEVAHPKKLAKALDADHHHKVIFKFALKDKASGEKIKAHQAFVRFYHAQSASEIIFVAEPDSNSVYKFDLDVSAKTKDFGGRSGKYEVHLIVGDAVISNPVSWHVADISLKFQSDDSAESGSAAAAEKKAAAGPLPEIRHMFREPEVRPPATVSNLFTLLCLAPILVMFIGWIKIGVNISNFPLSLTALGFHLGLAAIFVVYYYFWLQLNMFTTLKFLGMAGIVTFLCGNSLLVKIAEKRKHQ